MARKKATDTIAVEEIEDVSDDEIDDLSDDEIEDVSDDELEDIDDVVDFDDDIDTLETLDDVEDEGDEEGDDLDDGAEESDDAALDELEAAELSMLTPDEAAEVIRVDEAAEVASLRQAELALDQEADSVTAGEFVCSGCFLVKKHTQLANKRKQICNDCAA
jgi:hypothetical protein